MIIAIDGPSASGKGTLSKRLAAHFGFAHLDTGKIYRAVGYQVVRQGGDPEDEATALAVARALDPATCPTRNCPATKRLSPPRKLHDERGPGCLAAVPARFCREPPGGASGAVLDGRDIGTVVCPEAPVKLYVVASAEVRAERRHKELLERGEAGVYVARFAGYEGSRRTGYQPISRAAKASGRCLYPGYVRTECR